MSKNTNLRKITNYLTADNNTLSSNVSQTITGSLTVTGNLTAQQFIVSSSVTYLTESFASGSHKFGDSSDDIHTFTGSLVVSGSANPLRVGSNLLFISSSGNVGIGTTTPSDFIDATLGLAIIAPSGRSGLSLGSTQGTADEILGRLSFTNTNSSNAGGKRLSYISGIRGTTNNSAYIEFGTANDGLGTQRMVISQTGNVGIGTSSPSARLHTEVAVEGSGTGAVALIAKTSNGVNDIFRWFDGATQLGVFKNSGSVGIGTTSPSSKLHIVTTGNSFTPTNTGLIGGSTINRVYIQSGEPGIMLLSDINGSGVPTGTQTYQLGLQIGVYTTNDIRSQIYFGNSPLSFVYSGDQGVNGSERMRISTNGSIGAPNGTNIYNASDVRLKKNISTTTYGLDTITLLNPVKFNWIDGFEPTEDDKDMLGFVAQEVQTVIPEAIEGFGGNSITIGDTIIDNPLRVNEKFIIPVLVKAIQELSDKNTALEEILQRNNIV